MLTITKVKQSYDIFIIKLSRMCLSNRSQMWKTHFIGLVFNCPFKRVNKLTCYYTYQ